MSASLNEAAAAGNMDEVLMRLNLGEDVNQKLFPRFSAPLHDAIICGRVEVAKLLIKRGADVNLPDYRGLTPLRLSQRYGQDEIEAVLAEAGALKEIEAKPKEKTVIGVQPPWLVSSRKKRDEIAYGN